MASSKRVFTCVTKTRVRQKPVGLLRAAVNQLGFGSAVAPPTGGVSCDGAAKPELIFSCTVCFVA